MWHSELFTFLVNLWQRYGIAMLPALTIGIDGHPWINLSNGLVLGSFNCFVYVSLNKLLNNQSSCPWFETPWHSCHVIVICWSYHLLVFPLSLISTLLGSKTQTQTKFIQQKQIQVPYQIYRAFVNIQIIISPWHINDYKHVGRPPLRSYLTADMEATRKGKVCTAVMETAMQLDVN